MQRIDCAMVELGLTQSRERAKTLIKNGVVFVDGVEVKKPSEQYLAGQNIQIKNDPLPFVSRGGLKLLKSIQNYNICLNGKVCADIGASTGGFTDCMLQNGASMVYAIDVGTSQLDEKLRNDSRVISLEQHNARAMDTDWFAHRIDFASVDVSFISVKLIIPNLVRCMAEHGELVVLVKPQFEAGKNNVGKNGVVRNKSAHIEVLEQVVTFAIERGLKIKGIDYSPITGPKGNIEFLMYASLSDGERDMNNLSKLINTTVLSAHKSLS